MRFDKWFQGVGVQAWDGVLQAQGLGFQGENLIGCGVLVFERPSLVRFRVEMSQGWCFLFQNTAAW